MTLLQTIIISIVEGLTEFLPVSSTGHMIITQNLMGVQQGDAFVHAFTFIIQFGAILSVVCLYWRRFFHIDHTPVPADCKSPFLRMIHPVRFYWLLFVGVLPAVVIGMAAKKSGLLDWLLDSVWVVAVMLVVGGVFMLFCDRIFNKGKEANRVNEKRAFNIGLFQCLSVIPGTSRSMATIVGGMANGLTRRRAAEFSFFLAVPTMADDDRNVCLDYLEGFEEPVGNVVAACDTAEDIDQHHLYVPVAQEKFHGQVDCQRTRCAPPFRSRRDNAPRGLRAAGGTTAGHLQRNRR